MNQTILDRNLLSLGGSDPFLSAKISRAEESFDLRFLRSKTDKPVPAIKKDGRFQPLHSLFDPEREGLRYIDTYSPDGFFVFLGFGCGYHIAPFLEKDEISNIVIIEKDLDLFKALLSGIDLRKILLDPRVRFLIDPSPEELRSFFLSYYIPSIAGDLRTVSLRPRIEQEPKFFQNCLSLIKQSIETLSDDFTVQTQFGKNWFINSLTNLAAAERSTTVLVPKKRAIVTGAGPSLEEGIPAIRKHRSECLLIGTDTSLPVLMEYGLVPDMVISIDCQHITYNHFLAGYPKDVPLILDLASPPVITHLTPKISFFTSGHPFSQYINAHWRRFPFIDTSGGNVVHAAVSLADRLGVAQIYLYGADFSYPEGKSYARGAYIYPYFRSRENRFDPLESLFIGFLFRNKNIRKEWEGETLRYTTKPMISYKERLENASRLLDAELIPVRGSGEPILVRRKASGIPAGGPRIFSSGTTSGPWRNFLSSYRENLAALPTPKNPVMSYIFSLSQEERNLWTTLLPVAANLLKARAEKKSNAPALLDCTRQWALDTVNRFLRSV